MNKQRFEAGFIKAAMAEGLNYVEAAELYKAANGGMVASVNGQPTMPAVDFLQKHLQQSMKGSGGDSVFNGFAGGGLAGALGGGTLGALSADEEKGQSKWKRGFGGALAGGGLGALAGGGMEMKQQFDNAKDHIGNLGVQNGRSALNYLQSSDDPAMQSKLLEYLKQNRGSNEALDNFSFLDSVTRPDSTVKTYFNGIAQQ